MESSVPVQSSLASSDKPLIVRILPDLVAFSFGLSLAFFLKWETTDLVWSLWLGSLVLGYMTLLSALAGGAYIWLHAIRHPEFKQEHRKAAIFGGIAFGLFFIGFFSLHFCGFHAAHSIFLQQFFPVQGMPSDGFGDAFMNPLLLWKLVFQHLIGLYGFFLIPALIAERQHVFHPLMQAIRAVRDGVKPSLRGHRKGAQMKGRKSHPIGDAMARPYANVMRMHLLIFFFAFCHILKIDSFVVYATVYCIYFFPWGELKRFRDTHQAPDGAV